MKKHTVVIKYVKDNEIKELIREVHVNRGLEVFAKLEPLFALYDITTNFKVNVYKNEDIENNGFVDYFFMGDV